MVQRQAMVQSVTKAAKCFTRRGALATMGARTNHRRVAAWLGGADRALGKQ